MSLPAPYDIESRHTAYVAAALLNVHPNSDFHETHSTHDSSKLQNFKRFVKRPYGVPNVDEKNSHYTNGL